MITARTQPKLFLVQPSLDVGSGLLHIRIPYHGDHCVPLTAPSSSESITDLQVWGSHDITGLVVSPASSPLQAALSAYLETPVLLVQFQDSVPRILGDQRFLHDLFNTPGLEDALEYPLEDCTTSFADGFPFLLATEESFNAVSTWLANETEDVRMEREELVKRYRPNILIRGAIEAFEEDGWEEVMVGDDTLFPVSRCGRCPMPDVSPLTGSMSVRRMPGRIVEGHRKGVDRIVRGPCLGMNAIPKKRSGTLEVGSVVEVKRYARRNTDFERVKGEWERPEDWWS
ncbi:MAG: hypothetical protein CYPHOPRED_001018 [Cyphobasidiales sp. Tagirdzhanova-0007]|nr:MAG: hypothetical protein CYPHOPRED_001018 [Cyphobasidiales sp. Tagirdzhanova-0007]